VECDRHRCAVGHLALDILESPPGLEVNVATELHVVVDCCIAASTSLCCVALMVFGSARSTGIESLIRCFADRSCCRRGWDIRAREARVAAAPSCTASVSSIEMRPGTAKSERFETLADRAARVYQWALSDQLVC
jgi:hypothetical protein